MLVPTAMPGSARQDRNVDEFVHKTCCTFTPKQLRQFRRHQVCLSTVVMYKETEMRGFTLNISWGGAFIVDLQAERFHVGAPLTILIPEFDCRIPAEVRRIIPWGAQRYAPGIGLSFSDLDESASSVIADITRSHKEFDRDRLTA
jgi:Tfp pilus assembly protein PilZ